MIKKILLKRSNLLIWVLLILLSCSISENISTSFSFSEKLNRIWIGPDFWANRLQDWSVRDGKIMCLTTAKNRNIQLLTYDLDSTSHEFTIRSSIGFMKEALNEEGWIGIRFSSKGKFNDYRDNTIYGEGIKTGINTNYDFFLGDSSIMISDQTDMTHMVIELNGRMIDNRFVVTSTLFGKDPISMLATISNNSWSSSGLSGNIGFVSDFKVKNNFNRYPSAWFDNIYLAGDKIIFHPNHSYGPVLFTQYTLSRNILKLTAQLSPVGKIDDQFGTIEFFDSTSNSWINPKESFLDPDSRTLIFKIEDWNSKNQVPYRIVYGYHDYRGQLIHDNFFGIIRPDPSDKDEIKIAAFTGNNDLGFPDNDLIKNVKKHDADLYFFSGDQIYERVGGFGVQYEPVEFAMLDYLRKWYQFGWIYRDLIRSKPSISIPDDHDVFHGNIWGASGRSTPPGLTGTEAQDQGGYKMPARFINMVQRTQTGHLPDPYDPDTVLQGINVYFTDLRYGGISFAILEDRKFKSTPTPLLPKGQIWNGWAQNPDFDPKTESDHHDAELLGDRQLEFLEQWASDWSDGIWMKAVLSQTIFANVATLPASEVHDQNVPKLRILESDEYPPDDKLVADMDSNGWPKSGRDEALRKIRKAFAVHIAGDQHLGSTLQYGIDEYRDAGFAICVPSVSNIWPRRWYPPDSGMNREAGMPKYTGDYEDGFGNKMTILAVSNPVFTGKEPSALFDRATGYGIIIFNKTTRDITLENWPRNIDPLLSDSKPYPGWPVRINQLDNYSPVGFESLPEIKVTGMENPVLQLIDEQNDEILYTIRIMGDTFIPLVPKNGQFTLKVGEPEIEMKEIKGLSQRSKDILTFKF